jgi:CDP-diacylglycerol--serine O-phosphatidyltransferase
MTRYLKVADIATFASLTTAIMAVVLAMHDRLLSAGLLLIASLLLDSVDGRIARAMNQTSEFGMYLDSLIDIIAFGAVPAMIAFLFLPTNATVVIAAIIYLGASAYRLARFQTTKLKDEFQGMPITMNGLGFAAVLMFVPATSFWWVMPLYFLTAAALMVSTFRMRKL